MRKALVHALTHESEPLSRVEMWLGIITLYLVICAFVMGHFTRQMGTADRSTVIPATNRA
jgi:hypothetical protein